MATRKKDPAVTPEISEKDLSDILREDDALLDDLADKTEALERVLDAAAVGNASEEDIEWTYLSLINTLFQLSKPVNPLDGFGKDRLLAGISILEYFEKHLWPVSTKITAENAGAFRQFIPEEHFDDVVVGRKQAIGALRRIDNLSCAAGAVVCSVNREEETPVLRLEWIEVHENLRQQGVGNMLMALLLEPFVRSGDVTLVTELPIVKQDEEDQAEEEILENFLESWKIEFAVTSGRRFILNLSSLARNPKINNASFDGTYPLSELEIRGESMVRSFFRRQNNPYDSEFLSLPFSFFDPEVSTCIAENGSISALFLVHRFEDGNYRYEALRCQYGQEGDELPKLLRCAYAGLKERGGRGRIYGFFDSEEGRDAVTELIPEIAFPMMFSGALTPPEEVITTEMWDELRREAGFSDDKITDGEATEV